MKELSDLPDSYWVDAELLRAGRRPVELSHSDAAKSLYALFDLGIRIFVDLTMPDDSPSYVALLNRAAAECGIVTQYKRFPIPNMGITPKEQMKDILDYICENAKPDRKVYLHCHGGIGRTGLVVGCYLARMGVTPQKRLGTICELRSGTLASIFPSPETEEQRQYVINWHEADAQRG